MNHLIDQLPLPKDMKNEIIDRVGCELCGAKTFTKVKNNIAHCVDCEDDNRLVSFNELIEICDRDDWRQRNKALDSVANFLLSEEDETVTVRPYGRTNPAQRKFLKSLGEGVVKFMNNEKRECMFCDITVKAKEVPALIYRMYQSNLWTTEDFDYQTKQHLDLKGCLRWRFHDKLIRVLKKKSKAMKLGRRFEGW